MDGAVARIMLKFRGVIEALEKRRGSRIFCMVHGRRGHICEPSTLWPVIKQRKDFTRGKTKTLDVLLHSLGGDPDTAYRLMKFFRGRYTTVNALVPLKAKSAATLMCMGADRIYMGEFAELGPVDIQLSDPIQRGAEFFSPLDEFKSMEFMRDYAVEILDFFTGLFLERSGMSIRDAMHETIPCITGLMTPLLSQIDPLEMGEHRRSLAIGEEYASRLLALTKNPNADKIVEKLVWEYPSHDFAVDYDEAKELKLPVQHMDAGQENALLDILLELQGYEISFCGFIPRTKGAVRRAAPQQATRRRQPSKGVSGKQPALAAVA
jgi:hypothetical protein